MLENVFTRSEVRRYKKNKVIETIIIVKHTFHPTVQDCVLKVNDSSCTSTARVMFGDVYEFGGKSNFKYYARVRRDPTFPRGLGFT